MNPIIDEIYAQRQVTGEDGKPHDPFPVSIRRPEGDMLYRLVRETGAQATAEVGMAWGLSTLFFCQALKDNGGGKHVAMDPFQGECYKHAGVQNIHRAGLADLLEFHEESSHTVLPRLLQQGRRFDVMFIDGSHLFDAAFVDFFYADQLVPVGGRLVFDDLWMPAVRKVVMFALTNRHYEIEEHYLGPHPGVFASRWQNAKYQLRKRRQGRGNAGAWPESRFHLGRNVNWTVLRKLRPDDRPWDHFARF